MSATTFECPSCGSLVPEGAGHFDGLPSGVEVVGNEEVITFASLWRARLFSLSSDLLLEIADERALLRQRVEALTSITTLSGMLLILDEALGASFTWAFPRPRTRAEAVRSIARFLIDEGMA